MKDTILVDGESLTIEKLLLFSQGEYHIQLTDEAWKRVKKSRKIVENVLKTEVAYGINTGFGNFASVRIPRDKIQEMQVNLIRSHAIGVGEILDLVTTRLMYVLRINVLAKGYSGISPNTLQQVIDAFNADCLSKIPMQGTLGASGDLAQLSHLVLGLMGEGEMWDHETNQYAPAMEVLEKNGLSPLELQPKDGLSLINGTQFICAIASQVVHKARILCDTADVVTATTIEALRGTLLAFSPGIHEARPHRGQGISASKIRKYLNFGGNPPSEISSSHLHCGKVQDAYSLRCTPQIHGVVRDTVEFVAGIIETEMNSATDNPMVFGDTGRIISGGNFHGEYPSKALDYLSIALSELGNVSERRMERLVNNKLSDLPAFLVKEGGINSGFMIAHCTAAALVSENKTLAHPASVDSIPTSAAQEDHVSMGGWSARKAMQIAKNIENILAIELMAACQGIDFLRPLKSTYCVESVHEYVRNIVDFVERDRYMAPDIAALVEAIQSGDIVAVAELQSPKI
eukprot:TRINITY_DN9324_c0_g1_i1.p1 TRINITY_DN9324_c0_g1~~TRINITY_DN9324_c0_g1_i1.p1  ORF type:complete len:516 (-),score=116.74 TRINITY_DN9324_c0_g1_i1:57-1604(-)